MLSVYALRGAGPCHNSQSSWGGTGAGLPNPIDFLVLEYQALGKKGGPFRPSGFFPTIPMVWGDERCCVPICTTLAYFFCASTSSAPSAGSWLHGFST